MIGFADMEKLVGKALPGGPVTIRHYEDWLLTDAVGGMPVQESIHPIWAYLAPIAGLRMTWDDIFALADAKAADGPMLGEIDMEIFEPLEPETTYHVTGEITAVKRKVGKAIGVFDLMTFRLDLLAGERPVARSTQSLIFPRGA